MSGERFYIDLFTPETWREAGQHGYTVTGFSDRRFRYAQRIEPGDVFLCYLTGKSRFIAALRATSEVFRDETPIWKSQVFPTRFECELIVAVPEDQGIHLREVQQRSQVPGTYDWIFRASPQEMPEDDSRWLVARLHEIARSSPRATPVALAVGEDAEETPNADERATPAPPPGAEPPHTFDSGETAVAAAPERVHTRIQYLLAKLGRDMSLDVWIARDDKNRTIDGERLGDLSIDELPVSYDATTQGTIERIDLLWLDRNRIAAAFEIEATTAIYSGLLRMSDLLAMQPNIDIPLYIVAPPDRRESVLREIRRPTFARLETPLYALCRYLPFDALTDALARHGDAVKYMRPDFLDSIAERAG